MPLLRLLVGLYFRYPFSGAQEIVQGCLADLCEQPPPAADVLGQAAYCLSVSFADHVFLVYLPVPQAQNAVAIAGVFFGVRHLDDGNTFFPV